MANLLVADIEAAKGFHSKEWRLWSWHDDASTSPWATTGRIGFRQMSPMAACYRNRAGGRGA